MFDKDEIVEMARQAASHGVENHRSGEVSFVFYNEHLMNFAKLVAAKEREEILAMSAKQWFKSQHDQDEAIRARGEA